jgi:hypothetical protein
MRVSDALLLGMVPLALVGDARAWRPATLDLGAYELTFAEEFDALSVSARGPGTRWTAHTPFGMDFGEAAFADPEPGFPFAVEDGVLRIEARRGPDGRWRGGLLASVDPEGRGFAQRHGYFEMRAKLPAGAGVWPAFWLVENRPELWHGESGPGATSVEIDAMEFYGHSPRGYEATVHVWSVRTRPAPWEDRIAYQRRVRVPGPPPAEGFRDYGVEVAPDLVTFYLDRVEVGRTRTPPEYQGPMLVMLNLALGGGWPVDAAPDPSAMLVEHVRVYARKAEAPEAGVSASRGPAGPAP